MNCYECFARVVPPEDRELALRPPAIGLARPEPSPPGSTVFVILMLASVAYDGLMVTPLWLEIVRLTPVNQTLGLLVIPLLFLAVYLGFVKLSQVYGGGGVRLGRLASAYVYSLVPIAIAYQVAHYYTCPLLHVFAHPGSGDPGSGDNRSSLGPIQLGLEPLRHGGIRDQPRNRGRGTWRSSGIRGSR